jgi:hypothetical protein
MEDNDTSLNIDDSREFLNAVQENVALLDDILVLGILAIWAIGLNDSADLVNDGIDSSSRDES